MFYRSIINFQNTSMTISHPLVDAEYFYNSNGTNIKVHQSDIKQLIHAMKKQCIERKDIQELITIVKSEKPDFENRQLGENASDWILKVFGKAVNCPEKIDSILTAYSLATLIKQYYGIDH